MVFSIKKEECSLQFCFSQIWNYTERLNKQNTKLGFNWLCIPEATEGLHPPGKFPSPLSKLYTSLLSQHHLPIPLSPTFPPPFSSPLSPSSSHTCVSFKNFPFLSFDRTQVPESHVWHQAVFISSFSHLCEKGKDRGLAFVSFPHRGWGSPLSVCGFVVGVPSLPSKAFWTEHQLFPMTE